MICEPARQKTVPCSTPIHNQIVVSFGQTVQVRKAYSFAIHGLMHAPITALLVEAVLSGTVDSGHVRIPAPFDHATIDLSTFDPGRAFDSSHRETLVL